MVYVLLAEGFEEVEALTPVDLLRRAGVETRLVGVTGATVCGARGINVVTDLSMDEVDLAKADMLVLPGGMPGTTNLYADKRVTDAVRTMADAGKYVAAICAAPSIILGGMGLLEGKKATCYPGMEDGMTGATPVKANAVTDGKIITGCGVGGALDFACELITALCGKAKADEIAESVVHHGVRIRKRCGGAIIANGASLSAEESRRLTAALHRTFCKVSSISRQTAFSAMFRLLRRLIPVRCSKTRLRPAGRSACRCAARAAA